MGKKAVYKVKNWPEYNEALVKRGDITCWINPVVIEEWLNVAPSGKPGRPMTFSDATLEAMLALRSLFRLPLRSIEGLMRSIFAILDIEKPIPTYATLSRRQGRLDIDLGVGISEEPIHLLIDSTGLKVFGEGEWKARQHGKDIQRTWRKLHLGIDAATREIVAVDVTDNSVGDSTMLPELLLSVDAKISKVIADGAYDTWECRYEIVERDAEAIIPPRNNATERASEGSDEAINQRNEAVRHSQTHGKAAWKVASGYHKRSLVETTMFRVKKSFGPDTQARLLQNQLAEMVMKSKILNQFIQNGLPVTVRVGD